MGPSYEPCGLSRRAQRIAADPETASCERRVAVLGRGLSQAAVTLPACPRSFEGDASRNDDLQPLSLALREHHGSVTPSSGALRPADESWTRRRKTYADIAAEGGVLFLAVQDAVRVDLACASVRRAGRRRGMGARLPFDRRPGGAGKPPAGSRRGAPARGRGRGPRSPVAAVDINAAAPNETARRAYERHGYRLDLVTYRMPLH